MDSGSIAIVMTVGAFLVCSVGFTLVMSNTPTNQQTNVRYICNDQDVQYIIFDHRTMELSVDQNGNPVRCKK